MHLARPILLVASAILFGCGGSDSSGGSSDGGSSSSGSASVAPGEPMRVTVTLPVGDPSVNFVAPYVVPVGNAGSVIIRGVGFSTLSRDSVLVQFNSTPATTAPVVSDTEIRATHPPLSTGAYSISVSSGAASIPSRAALRLVVIDPPAFPLTTIPRPASASSPPTLIYDAERQALLFTDFYNGRILRYALSGNGDASSEVFGPGGAFSAVGRIALSPDGTELIRIGDSKLFRLDPVTLAAVSSVDPSLSLGSGNPVWFAMAIAFANDGGAIGRGSWFDRDGLLHDGLYRYDMLTQAFTPV